MATKQQVFDLHAKNPRWTAAMIAEALRCDSAYVRSTFYRAGMKLPKAPRPVSAAAEERERCAQIAERLGSPRIAAEIRRPLMASSALTPFKRRDA